MHASHLPQCDFYELCICYIVPKLRNAYLLIGPVQRSQMMVQSSHFELIKLKGSCMSEEKRLAHANYPTAQIRDTMLQRSGVRGQIMNGWKITRWETSSGERGKAPSSYSIDKELEWSASSPHRTKNRSMLVLQFSIQWMRLTRSSRSPQL